MRINYTIDIHCYYTTSIYFSVAYFDFTILEMNHNFKGVKNGNLLRVIRKMETYEV